MALEDRRRAEHGLEAVGLAVAHDAAERAQRLAAPPQLGHRAEPALDLLRGVEPRDQVADARRWISSGGGGVGAPELLARPGSGACAQHISGRTWRMSASSAVVVRRRWAVVVEWTAPSASPRSSPHGSPRSARGGPDSGPQSESSRVTRLIEREFSRGAHLPAARRALRCDAFTTDDPRYEETVETVLTCGGSARHPRCTRSRSAPDAWSSSSSWWGRRLAQPRCSWSRPAPASHLGAEGVLPRRWAGRDPIRRALPAELRAEVTGATATLRDPGPDLKSKRVCCCAEARDRALPLHPAADHPARLVVFDAHARRAAATARYCSRLIRGSRIARLSGVSTRCTPSDARSAQFSLGASWCRRSDSAVGVDRALFSAQPLSRGRGHEREKRPGGCSAAHAVSGTPCHSVAFLERFPRRGRFPGADRWCR